MTYCLISLLNCVSCHNMDMYRSYSKVRGLLALSLHKTTDGLKHTRNDTNKLLTKQVLELKTIPGD